MESNNLGEEVPNTEHVDQVAPKKIPVMQKKYGKKPPQPPRKTWEIYVQKNRGKYAKAHPELSEDEVIQYLKSHYDELPFANQKRWISQARNELYKWKREMKFHVDDIKLDVEAKEIQPKEPNYQKTPQWFYWNEKYRDFITEFPGLNVNKMNKEIGRAYENLAPEDKQVYIDLAEKDKIRFDREWEVYAKELKNPVKRKRWYEHRKKSNKSNKKRKLDNSS